VTNENDENATTTRVTRAKSAALSTAASDTKKSLPSKKSTSALGATGAAQTRKRAALGDVSNVTKTEGLSTKEGKDVKKAVSTKGSLAKAAQPTGVAKKAPSTRKTATTALSSKDKNSGVKRPASGSGIGHVSKKPAKAAEKVKVEKPVPVDLPVEKDENAAPAVAEPSEKEADVKPTKAPAKSAPLEVIAEPAEEVQDLDREDIDDPLMVSEYVVEIFDYLKELEIATMANANYMDNQNELEWKLRGILVDWLLEVHTRFRLLPETLFLAVNIIDRFLSTKVVQMDRLQLVGVTAMFIASKYEEVLSPHVQNFRHVADDAFTEEEILSAERFVLAALNYDLSYPNPMNFLRRISKADNYDIQTRTLGKYLLEISCLDHRFIEHPPSQVAAAAMYLARMVLQRGEWDATLAHYSGYTEEEIQPVLALMIDYLSGPVVHEAFFKKYASKKFLKASIVLRRWAKEYVQEYGNALQDEAKPRK